MSKIKKVIALSSLAVGAMGASLIFANNQSSKAAATDGYDIVKLIAQNMTDEIDQEVTIVYNGSSFIYKLHNVSKDVSNHLVINNGYLYNITALNGLNYVDATSSSGNGIMAFGEQDNGVVNPIDRFDGLNKFVNEKGATNFAIACNSETTITSIEVSYSCTNGDPTLVDTSLATFSSDFYAYKTFIYIETASDYETLTQSFVADQYNCKDNVVCLMDDITLNDFVTPIGSSFYGDFDGNGYTITTDNTLLPTLSTNAIVRDLAVNGSITCMDSNCGVIARQIENNVIINNVQVSGNIDNAHNYTGGFVGLINEGNFIIKNSISKINISSTDGQANIGGFVGGTSATERSGLIRNCKFAGSLSGKNIQNIGGIAGRTYADITDCNNEGTNFEVTTTSSSKYIGGIAGQSYGVITRCHNKVDIRGYSYTGGISGYAYGLIDSCTNNKGISSDDEYVGGIAGRNDSIILNSSYEDGTILVSHGYAGGISGAAYGNITSCTFKGTVRNGYGCVGGITGATFGINIADCVVTSSAKIQCIIVSSSTTINVGGLIGKIQGGYVTGCSTSGVVSQSSGDYSQATRFGGFAGTVTTYKNASGTVWMPVLSDNIKPTNAAFPYADVENGNEANKYLGYVFGCLDSNSYSINWAK